MKPIKFQQHILPHLIAVLAFLVITVLFFSPIYFDDKALNQGDIAQWEASAQELIEYREATGEEGLWTNSIFGGMPAYLISVKWSNGLIKTAHAIFTLGLPHPTRLIFGAMLSFYIMLLCFKVRPYIAIMGALAFGLSSYNVIGLTAGHNARIAAVSFMPLVLGGIHLAFGKHKWLGAGLTALALAMEIRVNHLQITYYLAFIVALYGLMRLIEFAKAQQLRFFLTRLALLFGAAILAVGSTFGELYTTYEYGKYSNRGQSELTQQANQEMNEDGLSTTYAFQYSNGIWDPLTLFIPNALGGGRPFPEDGELANFLTQNGIRGAQVQQYLTAVPTYWGKESPTTYYAGAIMTFLMVLALMLLDRKYTIWLVAVALLGILFSYGRNLPGFNYFMFEHFPGYNKFRSVTFTMIMPIFALALMGCLALENIMSQKFDKALQKKLWIAMGSTAGLALVIAAVAGIFGFRSGFDARLPDDMLSAVLSDRKGLLRNDALRTFGLISGFGVVLFLMLKKMVKPQIACALLVFIAALDVIPVSNRFITGANYVMPNRATLQPASAADQYILQQRKLGDRVINASTPAFYDGRASQFHHLVNGYHGARIRRYQEIIDNGLITEFQRASSGDLSKTPLLNMLNTKYVIQNPQDPTSGVIENTNALGAAWFVGKVVSAATPDEEFQETLNLESPGTTAVIPADEVSATVATSIGTIDLVEYHPGYWKYESRNAGDGFAVFSEIYYPKGFEVTIDGQAVDMTKANYILRGLAIPAGEHVIEFRFNPQVYAIGNPIMLVMSILVLLSFAVGVYVSLKVDEA